MTCGFGRGTHPCFSFHGKYVQDETHKNTTAGNNFLALPKDTVDELYGKPTPLDYNGKGKQFFCLLYMASLRGLGLVLRERKDERIKLVGLHCWNGC